VTEPRRNLLDALLRLAPHDFEPDVLELLERPAWHADAACRGVGPSAFYPERGESLEPAREHCRRCSVTVECAAAGAGEDAGVWAGQSGRQRRLERPRQRRRVYAA
jgi:WhiB family transcriptional regulator, redox-sensing transcriptional regulator